VAGSARHAQMDDSFALIEKTSGPDVFSLLPTIALQAKSGPVTTAGATLHAEMELFEQREMNLLDMLIAVCLNQFVLLFIVVQQADGLAKKDIQALLDSLTSIVRTLIEFASINIADTAHLRRAGGLVTNIYLPESRESSSSRGTSR